MTILDERFWSKVVDGPDRCWLWIAGDDGMGYGTFFYEGANKKAHRASYEGLVRPIPAGMTLDHLCRNRRCVNPKHLEVVSLATNVLRGNSPTAINSRKTHCAKGHPLTPRGYQPGRQCVPCLHEGRQRLRADRKALAELSV